MDDMTAPTTILVFVSLVMFTSLAATVVNVERLTGRIAALELMAHKYGTCARNVAVMSADGKSAVMVCQ
jgi:hypothetical protein